MNDDDALAALSKAADPHAGAKPKTADADGVDGIDASNDQLQALTAQLQKAQHDDKANVADDGLFFGLSFGALMIGMVLSTVGVGFFRYARVVGQWSFAIVGAVLFILPFVITDAVWLSVAGGGAIALTFVVRRFVTF